MSLIGDMQFLWEQRMLGPIAGAGLTAIVTLAILWFNRKKPSIVECRELESFSLLRISPLVRKRIDVQFDGKKVNAISQSQIEVVNCGAETLDSVSVMLEFPRPTKVLEVVVSPAESQYERVSETAVKVTIPYLNPFRPHRERVVVSVICEGSTRELALSGRGRGWSVKHSSLIGRLRNRLFKLAFFLLMSGIVAVAYNRWVALSLGVPYEEISVRRIFAYAPGMLPTIVVYLVAAFLWRSELQQLRRMLDTDLGERNDEPKVPTRIKRND